ncbi:SDR family oxidoreductase [Hyalangium versicolor]|uniref:SDR family oxidoreductase n=1 Tax=Hyalangium versicolor TaxID=2861190 RepID=UPI001CCDEA6A|nr:SDR family oxidoreductase [Hyalangium versicolor]
MDWKQARIVVMGGSSGIGAAAARLFVQRGAEVLITGRDAKKLEGAKAEIGRVGTAVVDGTDAAAVRGFFGKLGAFDHLVLSLSGGEGMGPFRELDLTKLRGAFEAKFWAQLTVAQAALPTLKANGSITFVTAASARAVLAGTSGLAAINGSLEIMVPILALELAPVRVNAVSPGVVDTPWWENMPEEQRKALFAQFASTLPVRRVGAPEDIADAIGFVVGNGFMTGSVVECDGGARLV